MGLGLQGSKDAESIFVETDGFIQHYALTVTHATIRLDHLNWTSSHAVSVLATYGETVW